MKTKLDAGKIATAGGTTMVIASGRDLQPDPRHFGRRPLHLVPRRAAVR